MHEVGNQKKEIGAAGYSIHLRIEYRISTVKLMYTIYQVERDKSHYIGGGSNLKVKHSVDEFLNIQTKGKSIL